jgi:hypothetical protein
MDSRQCLIFSPTDGIITGPPSGEDNYCYPPEYGSFACRTWDENLEPFCANEFGPLANRPGWCADQFCYVDPDNCVGSSYSRSGFFPHKELYYSYETCGSQTSYDDWLASGGTADLSEIADVVENYLVTATATIESGYKELESTSSFSAESAAYCAVPSSCACQDCNSELAWNCEKIDFSETQAVFGCMDGVCINPDSVAATKAQCVGRDLALQFQRVATKEYNDVSRVGYQYFGDQDTGVMLQWPEMAWCNDGKPPDYDPRFRPWYSLAASGSKDVVIVIDKSGSMMTNGRIETARLAVLAVIDTLTWGDFATIVLFSNTGLSWKSELVQMTDDNKKWAKEWVNNDLVAGGGTNFRAGFEVALDALKNSRSCSNCNSVILFMTDGEDDSWDSDDAQWLSDEAAELGCNSIMTYALGDGVGADSRAKLKRIACMNSGIFYRVSDGASTLADTMSKYFEYIASGTAYVDDVVRWILYTDVITNGELLAGCKAAFNRDVDPPELLGVTCIDVNVIADLNLLKSQPTWSNFAQKITDETAECHPVVFNDDQLNAMRKRVSGSFAQCDKDVFTVRDDLSCKSKSFGGCEDISADYAMTANRNVARENSFSGVDECKLQDSIAAVASIAGIVVVAVLMACCKVSYSFFGDANKKRNQVGAETSPSTQAQPMPMQQMPMQQMAVQPMPTQQMPLQQMPMQQMPMQQMPYMQPAQAMPQQQWQQPQMPQYGQPAPVYVATAVPIK